MKFDYELSSLAIDDIEAIWDNTVSKWSLSQAEKYYKEIFEAIDLVCDYPEIGKPIQEVKKPYRIKLIGSHMIIYKIESQRILIDRILHQRMNINDE